MGILKFLGISSFLGVALFGAYKVKAAASAYNVGTHLIVDVANFNLKQLSLDLILVNTVNDTIKITAPVVEIFVGEDSVAYSSVSNQKYTLEPLGTLKIKIKLALRQTNFLNLFKAINQPVTANYSLYANDMPYRSFIQIKQ